MTHPCLKCRKILTQDGEAVFAGEVYHIFQCDQCTTQWSLGDGGESVEVALTFAVAPDGTIVDPRDPTKPMTFN